MSGFDIKALQLVCRFSLPPNSLGFCGKSSAPERLKKCVISGDCADVEGELSHFVVLYPYLKTISEITNLPVFSYPVIESYWLGNDELKKAKPDHYNLLLENFSKQGVPEDTIEEFKRIRPKIFIPNHFFQVLRSHPNLDSINNCMIRWGTVERIDKDILGLNIKFLEKQKQNYKLSNKREELKFYSDFLSNLKVGDTVAVHWKQVVKIVTDNEKNNLSYWTKEILKII